MCKMNILMVAGNFERNAVGKPSKLASSIAKYIEEKCKKDNLTFINGGTYEKLTEIAGNENLLRSTDVVFWFANVPDNTLPKYRDVKKINPKIMLISSKRNDNEKYSFQELVQRSLIQKANLMCEFSKQENGLFNLRVLDPLGCVWADTTDIKEAVYALLDRLGYIISITRQATTEATEDKALIMKWYFDQFKQPEYKSEKNVSVPDEQKFVDLVKKYAHKFQEFMPCDCKTERFIGNASLRPTPVGRCGKGMPSFRHKNFIFVSKRNIDKQFIELDSFVPVYIEDGKLYYCGKDKPSVDTPVQVKLYTALPRINYILHSHCYLKDAPYTDTAIPCGAIEEFDEIMKFIDRYYEGNRNLDFYAINLIGHGSIIMANNTDYLEGDIEYMARTLPEKII